MSRYALAREILTPGLLAECRPMLLAGFKEFEHLADELPADPDEEAYERLEAAGILRVYTARADGEIVGYAAFLVARSLRRRYMTIATQDLIHAKPEHRRYVTVALLRHAERELAAEGVQMLYHPCPIGPLGRLLELMGYSSTAQTLVKRLR